MKFSGSKIIAASALFALAFVAGATAPQREQAQFSILLEGSVDIDPGGGVSGYSIKGIKQLAPSIAAMIAKQVSQWKFEPIVVDGKAMAARTHVSMRLLATPNGDGKYAAGIQSVWFSGDTANNRPEGDGSQLSIRQKAPLRYPGAAERAQIAGTVYAALKIGPDGAVLDAVVVQVNLTAEGAKGEMAKARKDLGNNTLASLRRWTFNVPTKGDQTGKPYWIGMLPVRYEIAGTQPRPEYGEWEKYIPGPRTDIPWADPDGKRREAIGGGIDALPSGEMTLDDSGPRLLTPLMQG